MAIRTIFNTVEDCSLGARRGWVEFIRDYAPIARTLLLEYFPSLKPDIEQHLAGIFARAHADSNAWFRSLQFTNEREFAMAFRELVFVYGRSVERLPAPALTADDLARALAGLSLIQREFFWGFLKGWNVEEISAMLMDASATAQEAKRTADERLTATIGLPSSPDRTLRARAALDLAKSASTPDCLSWKTCNNLVNGQVSWLERERAEQHIASCLHCLDAFTAFQEMIWLNLRAQPLPQTQVDHILSTMKINATSTGLLSRLFSKAS